MTAPRSTARLIPLAFLVPFLLGLSRPAVGQVPEMLADLGAQQSIWELADISGTLFFAGSLSTTGMELWRSDGTAIGTALVKDLWPGTNQSQPRWFADLDGIALFQAWGVDPYQGAELWRSDGTDAGTSQVNEIIGGYYLTPTHLIRCAGRVYFNGGGSQGQELHVTDGTPGGTYVVKDIWPGSASSGPSNFAVAGDVLFFTASDGVNGVELWRTDGSETGTYMVKNIHPTGDALPAELTAVGGTLFFMATDGNHGQELWKSDGTDVGTAMVKDIRPGVDPAAITSLAACNGLLFFGADDGVHGLELWKSDGTEAGTVLVRDLSSYGGSYVRNLGAVGNTLFFQAAPLYEGAQLLKSDGTAAGTVVVKYINPSGSSSPYEITPYNGKAYFIADDGTHGEEPWVSDGTDTGTVMVQDIAPGFTSSMNAKKFKVSGGRLYFSASVPDAQAKVHAQLWMLETGSSSVGDGFVTGAGLDLAQSQPNPFRTSTSIRYRIPQARPVTLQILDVQGRVVRVLRDGALESAGAHMAAWDGCDDRQRELPSGVYLCRLHVGDEARTRAVVRMR
jgi:trimeric autotransporter adhesin